MKLLSRVVLGVVFFIISLMGALSLITYNSSDPSYIFNTAEHSIISYNLLGSTGAHIAGFLLYYFGCTAFGLIILIFIFGLALCGFINNTYHKDHYIAGSLLIVTFSIISSIYNYDYFRDIEPGGCLGYTLKHALYQLINRDIAHLFLYILSIASLVVITQKISIKIIIYTAKLIACMPFKKNIIKIYSRSLLSIRWGIHSSKSFIISLWDDQNYIEESKSTDILEDSFWQEYIPSILSSQTETQENSVPNNTLSQSLKNNNNTNTYSNNSINTEIKGVINTQHDTRHNTKNNTQKYNIPMMFLEKSKSNTTQDMTQEERRGRTLEEKLEQFGVKGSVVAITQGPVVTLFEYSPFIDTKINTIIARQDDLALALKVLSLRIIAPIPGKSVVGFEVAHDNRQIVLLSEIIASSCFKKYPGKLPLVIGKNIRGDSVIIDLETQPHILIAGSTGSGKSVGLNSIIMSLLCSQDPEDLKLILIDPKRLEFGCYQDIAHLLFPIVVDSAQAVKVLKWAVSCMEKRYKIMAHHGVRNIQEYSALTDLTKESMPFIIIIIDELADLMMTAGKDVEYLLARLAQMARACGIHLIIATQRPSVDVVTGLIKVNFLSRIAFKVISKIDSRTILDTHGAERLLGKGDSLFLNNQGILERVHGCYVDFKSIYSVVNAIRTQRATSYEKLDKFENNYREPLDEMVDEIYTDIITFIQNKEEISISSIQRVFKIGYNRSARIVERLELEGYILPPDGSKMRKVAKKIEN